MADRAEQMCSLIADSGASGGSGLSGGRAGLLTGRSRTAVPVGDQVPTSGAPAVVARVTFWVSALAEVLDAIAASGSDAGVRPAVGGPAGAGMLYACSTRDRAARAARFVATLRERVAGPRGGVAVLAAPAEVLAATQAYRDVPGAALMRAVKDQFDPGNRMSPGRMAGVI